MFAILRSLRSVVVSVVNGVSRDGRVDGVGPRHGNLDSPIVERLYGAVFPLVTKSL